MGGSLTIPGVPNCSGG